MRKPILTVKHLTKAFGSFTAVDDLSFELGGGEILGMLGPNGAGKTTTLQMLLGVLTPTSGSIHYFGKDLAKHRSEIMDQVGFSSTYVSLPDLLTVEESLTFVSYFYDRKHRRERVAEVVKQFNLEPLQHQFNNALSAGQKTRVNLAKAFLHEPHVLLLDEPTASLDPDIAQEVRGFLRDLREQSNLSVIITSHNMSEVEELCDRVIVIREGRLIAESTPEKLARSVDVCHLQLGTKNTSALRKFCLAQNLSYKTSDRHFIIDVSENRLAEILQTLEHEGIRYDEISIEKPSLEDYFLRIAKPSSYEVA